MAPNVRGPKSGPRMWARADAEGLRTLAEVEALLVDCLSVCGEANTGAKQLVLCI